MQDLKKESETENNLTMLTEFDKSILEQIEENDKQISKALIRAQIKEENKQEKFYDKNW